MKMPALFALVSVATCGAAHGDQGESLALALINFREATACYTVTMDRDWLEFQQLLKGGIASIWRDAAGRMVADATDRVYQELNAMTTLETMQLQALCRTEGVRLFGSK